MTGVIPPRIQIPQTMLPARKVEVKLHKKPETKTVSVGCEKLDLKESSTQTEEETTFKTIENAEIVFTHETYDPVTIIAPPAEFSEIEPENEEIVEYEEVNFTKKDVKILNKGKPETSSSAKQFKKPSQLKIERLEAGQPKILNRQLQPLKFEVTMVDSIGTSSDGNLIVSINEEYLDDTEMNSQDKSNEGVVYTCNVCERSFPLEQQLQIHQSNHERERNHPCDNCDKSFFSKYDLAKHLLTHTKQKDYTCIVCKKSFSRSTLLYRHEKIHTDPKIPRHPCEDCDRVYLNIADYEKHVLIHTKNRRFECSYCDKRFAFKQGLERHQTIHDEAQPHACSYCDLKFPTAARLQRHLSNEHAGKRPFPCSKCTKRFMLSHHLYRHMRTTHSNFQNCTFRCPHCEMDFSEREEFFIHCQEHAEENHSCPLCKLSFESSEDAVEHLNIHEKSDMHFCDYCNLIFTSFEDLNHHFDDQHSTELCSIGEEVEFVIQEKPVGNKRKTEETKIKPVAKKGKRQDSVSFDIQEIESEQFEFLNDEKFEITEINSQEFVEYEEIDQSLEAPSPSKLEEPKRKTYAAKISKGAGVARQLPTVPAKKLPVKVERVKMSQAKIEQLKKEGKIKIINGEMIMKS